MMYLPCTDTVYSKFLKALYKEVWLHVAAELYLCRVMHEASLTEGVNR